MTEMKMRTFVAKDVPGLEPGYVMTVAWLPDGDWIEVPFGDAAAMAQARDQIIKPEADGTIVPGQETAS